MYNRVKIVPSINGVEKIGQIDMQKDETGPISYTIYQN